MFAFSSVIQRSSYVAGTPCSSGRRGRGASGGGVKSYMVHVFFRPPHFEHANSRTWTPRRPVYNGLSFSPRPMLPIVCCTASCSSVFQQPQESTPAPVDTCADYKSVKSTSSDPTTKYRSIRHLVKRDSFVVCVAASCGLRVLWLLTFWCIATGTSRPIRHHCEAHGLLLYIRFASTKCARYLSDMRNCGRAKNARSGGM